ncbi:hypothetical protein B7P43_G18094 [Cryptotermes secundus]|uniref:Uncharacterized protein n=1 Tax=Cryptotermes secundus TaxID=105785 RepID=A0A2J7QVJ5_9NEOP|nr:hypothetical protein B7P43_G18094 [Cryptotermes secundus]
MPVGEPKKKRRRDRKRRIMKNPTRKNCGLQNKLAVVSRKVSRSARVAWRKRNIFRKSWTRGDHASRIKLAAICRKISRRATVARRWRSDFKKEIPQGTFGCQTEKVTTKDVIGGCKSVQRSHQEGRICKKTIYEIVSEKIAKGMVGSSVSLRQHKDWTLWRGRPPPKRKKEQGTEEEPVK